MASISPKRTIETPKGKLTGSNPINGFQIITLKEFNNNSHIPDYARNTHHKLYFDLVIVFTKGRGTHSVDYVEYNYEPGSIFLIKKNQYHRWNKNMVSDGYLMFFTEGFENNFGRNFTNKIIAIRGLVLTQPNINIKDNLDQNFYIKLLELITYQFHLNLGTNKVLSYLLSSFLLKLETDYISSFPAFQHPKNLLLFQKFQSLLENEIKSSRNGTYYIAKLDTSFNHLNEVCKSISGNTVKQHINNFIVTKAKIALKNRKKNISEIAFDLGFNEVGNFSKFIRKHTGINPKEFKNNHNS